MTMGVGNNSGAQEACTSVVVNTMNQPPRLLFLARNTYINRFISFSCSIIINFFCLTSLAPVNTSLDEFHTPFPYFAQSILARYSHDHQPSLISWYYSFVDLLCAYHSMLCIVAAPGSTKKPEVIVETARWFAVACMTSLGAWRRPSERPRIGS
jgi:hypothetical protein